MLPPLFPFPRTGNPRQIAPISSLTTRYHPHRYNKMPATSTIILCWALALLFIGYLVLLYRYHYRTPDTITILQCTADDFSPDLLRERQPIVCKGMGDTSVFATLRRTSPSSQPPPSATADITTDANHQAVYTRLQHIAPWFSTPQPIRPVTPTPATTSLYPFRQSQWEVRLLVQLHGTSRVWCVAPGGVSRDGPTGKDGFVEVVLREGDGVFVPFLWWYGVVGGDRGSGGSVVEVGWTREWRARLGG